MRQLPSVLLATTGASLIYFESLHYDPGPDSLGVLPQIGLVVCLVLGSGAIAISIRSVRSDDIALPLAILVGTAVAYGVGISDKYFLYQHRALFLWTIPISGVVMGTIVWVLLAGVNKVNDVWETWTPTQQR